MLTEEELSKFFGSDFAGAASAIIALNKLPAAQKKFVMALLEHKEHLGDDKRIKDMILKQLLGNAAEDMYSEQSLLRPPWQKTPLHDLFPHNDLLSNFPLPRSNPSCDRCGNIIHGKYYKLENKDFCRRCMRRIHIRQKMLVAMPNREIQKIAISAVKDLRDAAKYDSRNEQIKTNLKNIKPLLSAAGGRGITFFCFWAPLWLIVRGWDILTAPAGFLYRLLSLLPIR